MGIWNLLKWEDFHWSSLIGPVSYAINDQLHGNVRRRKLLCAKREACKGIEMDAKRQAGDPLKWNRCVSCQKSCHTHVAVLPHHAQRIEHRRIAKELKH